MNIDILGTRYKIVTVAYGDTELLSPDEEGNCDNTDKQIVVTDYTNKKPDKHDRGNLKLCSQKLLRHEIIHAFLFESGLAENSNWAMNEEMVDFFAIQFPKLQKAFLDADAL